MPSGRMDQVLNDKKKKCYRVEFDFPVIHRVKIKERKRFIKYLDFARELKKKKDC